MRKFIVILMQLLFFLPALGFAAHDGGVLSGHDNKTATVSEVQKAAVIKQYGKLPLYFIENKGQVDRAVKFYERGAGHATFFTGDGVVLSLTKMDGKVGKNARHRDIKGLETTQERKTITEALSLSFVGANKKAKISADDRMAGKVNYFIGNDHSKWRTGIPTYGAVTYKDLYKNIDIKFYGNNRRLEHDIIVRPGGDFSLVKFASKGIQDLKVTKDGGLEVILKHGKIIEKRPVIYQEIGGKRVAVKGSYRIFKSNKENFEYGFNVVSYDRTKDLVIDPVLVYSTYLGGTGDESPWGGIAVDNTGAAYVAGYTHSHDFPVVSPFQGIFAGGWTDAFVTKINPAGNAIVYSTYLGGSDNVDAATGIAVDSSGAAYITGYTGSTDFPLLVNLQGHAGYFDAFVTELNPAGSALVFSTYLGGSDDENVGGIAVNARGDIKITGMDIFITGDTFSADFPTTVSSVLNGLKDAFVVKLNYLPLPGGSGALSLDFSTLIGGSGFEYGRGIAVNSKGEVYITGSTQSADFPLQDPFQSTYGGTGDAFVASFLRTTGNVLHNPSFSSYLGGSSQDDGYGVAVDAFDNVYVTGQTASTDFPVLNAVQPANAGFWDTFVTKITPPFPNVISYSTYLGGSGNDFGHAIAADPTGNVAVTGSTNSLDFPLVNPIDSTGGGDAFVTEINTAGSALTMSTYLGGSNGSETGYGVAYSPFTWDLFVTGETWSTDFPLVSPIQGAKSSFDDAFISKISGTPPPVVYLTMTPDSPTVVIGNSLGYDVSAVNTTATTQCFQYWETVSLPNGSTYPPTGTLFGPVHLCLNAGASKTAHLTHGVPMTAPLGTYVFNAFIGAYIFPIVVDEAHFNFDVLGIGLAPSLQGSETSWRMIENGFRK